MIHPFGAWPSPLDAERAASGGVRFGGVALTEARDGTPLLWWSSTEDGSNRVRVAHALSSAEPKGSVVEAVTSARSRVNEYGGGAFWVHGESLFWVEDSDQRIRRLDLSGAGESLRSALAEAGDARPLTPDPPRARSVRHAAGVVEPGGAWMVVERETHTDPDGTPLGSPVNDLAWLPTGLAASHPTASLPEGIHQLVADADFVAAPTLSPDGLHLAWLRWNHPDMPWDSTELMAGRLRVGGDGPVLESVRRVAGGPDVAVCLPRWAPDGRLWWCDDRYDQWALVSAPGPGLPEADGPVLRAPTRGEVGYPRWVSGGSRFGFAQGVVAAASSGGLDHLEAPEGEAGPLVGTWPLAPGWIDTLVATEGRSGPLLAAIAGSPAEVTSVVVSDRGASRRFGSEAWPLTEDSISLPEPVTFTTGADGAVAHGLFYPPKLADTEGPPDELPPLVVRIHGGPTAAARAELSGSVQFWTTRGFAVVDVNYRGSTGYGRAFRNLLHGGWGDVEVRDCIAAAEHLADTGRVDPRRCVIRGGSAGGFTALEAVAAPPTDSGFSFAAATTLYGVTDLMSLASDTHKFESRYLDRLVGELPGSEELYRQRSPLHHPERISAPVLVLQGLDDPVVPPAQAEVLVEALEASGIDHEYRTYAGEGHGFRRLETIVDALGAELAFYQRVLGIN